MDSSFEPLMAVLLLAAIPRFVSCFFIRFVEPRVEVARVQTLNEEASPIQISDIAQIASIRAELEGLRIGLKS